jgi:DNA polymerase III alpha subunit
MEQQKDKFIEGCLKNNYDKELAEKVWKEIDAFSGYGCY